MASAAGAWSAAIKAHDGPAGAEIDSWFDRKLRAMRLGLFGVLHVMNRDAATSWRSFVLFAFIDFNQMLNFVFNSSQTLALPWKGTVVAWVAQYLSFFKFSILLVEASSLFFPLFFLVVLIYIVVSGMAAMAGRSFLQHRFQHLWVLHFLRWWARFSLSVLYLPFQSILFTAFACVSADDGAVVHSIDPTVTCWQGFHLLVAFAGVLALFLQVGFSAVIALMFVDRDPSSPSPDAAPHGRVALFNVASKAILNFVVVAVGDRNVWLLVIVFVVVGVSQVALSLGLLPYFSVRANQLTTVFAAIFAWGTCSLLVALLDPSTGAAATIFFVGSPFVAFIASSSVIARYHAIARTPIPSLRFSLLVEVKMRHILSLVATEDEVRAAEGGAVRNGTGDDDGDGHGGDVQVRDSDEEEEEGYEEEEDGSMMLLSADSAPDLAKTDSPGIRHRHRHRHPRHRGRRHRREDGRRRGVGAVLLSPGGVRGSTPQSPASGRGGDRPSAVGMRAARQLWPVDADRGLKDPAEIAKARISWRVMEGVYRAAQRYFPHATVLHMYLAVVYDSYAKSEELAMEEVKCIESAKHSYLDERYFAFARRRRVLDRAGDDMAVEDDGEDDLAGPVSLEQGSAVGSSANDPIRFITFEHHVNETKRSAQMARMVQVAFWNELKGTEPDLNKLFDIGSRLHRYIRATHRHFREVLKLKGGSPDMLRLYAGFLLDVVNDREQSERLVKRAAHLEASRTKDLATSLAAAAEGGPGPDAVAAGSMPSVDAMLDPLDDRNAVITVTSSPQHRGVVTAANVAAERLTGRLRRDIVGRNVSVIVPEPFASVHDRYLQRYEETGSRVIIGTTRPVFARHASGALNLVHLSVQEGSSAAVGGGESRPGHIFIGVMQPIIDRSQHALIDAEGVLRGCSLGCAAMFGRTLEEVGKGSMHVTSWLPDFYNPAFATAARGASGTVLRLSLYLPHYFSPDRLSLFDLLQLQLLVPSSEARALGVDAGDASDGESTSGVESLGDESSAATAARAPSLRRGSLLRWFLSERPSHEAHGTGVSHVAAVAARSSEGAGGRRSGTEGEGAGDGEAPVVPTEEGVPVDRVWCGIPLVRARVPVFVHVHDMSGGGVRASTLTFRPLMASYEATHGGNESEGVVSDPDNVSLSMSAASASAAGPGRGYGSQESLARVAAANTTAAATAAGRSDSVGRGPAGVGSPFATANVAARLLAAKRSHDTPSSVTGPHALHSSGGGGSQRAGLANRWQSRAASRLDTEPANDLARRVFTSSLSSRAHMSSMAPAAMTLAARGRMLRGSFFQGTGHTADARASRGEGEENDFEGADHHSRLPGPPSRAKSHGSDGALSADSGHSGKDRRSPFPSPSSTGAPHGADHATPQSASAAGAQGTPHTPHTSPGPGEDRMARVARRLASKSLHALHEVVRRLNSERDSAVVALEMALRLVTISLVLLAIALVAAQHGTLAAQRSAAAAAVSHDERAESLYGVACRCHDADIARRNVPTVAGGVALQNESRPFLAHSLVLLQSRHGDLADAFLPAQPLAVTEAVESAAARKAGAARAERDFNGSAEAPLEPLGRDMHARAAVLEVVNKAELVLEAALGALMPLRTAIFFVVHNAQRALRTAMEHGAAAAREEVHWATGVARAAALLSGALLLPAVVVAAGVLFAAVSGVERAKDRILTLFVDIPHRTTLRIYMRCVAAREAHRSDMGSTDKALTQLAQELDTGQDDAAAHLRREKGQGRGTHRSGRQRRRRSRSKRKLRRRSARSPARRRGTPGEGGPSSKNSPATIHTVTARASGGDDVEAAVARPAPFRAVAEGSGSGDDDSSSSSSSSSVSGGGGKPKGAILRRMSVRFQRGREEREQLVAQAARAAADHEASTRQRIRSPAARTPGNPAASTPGESPSHASVDPAGVETGQEAGAGRDGSPTRDSAARMGRALSGGEGDSGDGGEGGIAHRTSGSRRHGPPHANGARLGFRPSRLDPESLRRHTAEGEGNEEPSASSSSPRTTTDDSTSDSHSSQGSALSVASLASEEQQLYMWRAEQQYERHQRRGWLRLRLLPSQRLSGSILRGASKRRGSSGSGKASGGTPGGGKTAEQQRLLRMLTPKQHTPPDSASDSAASTPSATRSGRRDTFSASPAASLARRGGGSPPARRRGSGKKGGTPGRGYARTESLAATLDWVGRGASVLTDMRGRRHFVKRSGGLTTAMLRIFTVLVALAVFALVNTLSALETAGDVESLARTALAASERARHSRDLQLRLRRQVEAARGGSGDAGEHDDVAAEVVAEVRALRELQEALLYGSQQWGTLPPGDDLLRDRQFALELQDACFFVEEERRPECRALARSVLASGLHAAVAEALDASWLVAASDQRAVGLEEAWASAPLALTRQLDMRFLGDLLRLAASMHLEALGERMESQVVLSWTLVTVLVGVQVVLHTVVSRQLLRRVEDDLRHARSMLLMIPGDVARRIPSVRQYIREATLAARRRAEQSQAGRGSRRSSRVFNTQEEADLMPSVWSSVKAYLRLRGRR